MKIVKLLLRLILIELKNYKNVFNLEVEDFPTEFAVNSDDVSVPYSGVTLQTNTVIRTNIADFLQLNL